MTKVKKIETVVVKTRGKYVSKPKTNGSRRGNEVEKVVRTKLVSKKSVSHGNPKMSIYQNAVVNPFSPEAEGARVDDGYPLPTRTDHVTQSWDISTTDTAGIGQILLVPNAGITAVTDGHVSIVGSGTATGLSSGNVYGMLAESVFDGLVSATRLVAMGFKIKNQLNFSTITGKVCIAPIVFTDKFITQATLTAGAWTFSALAALYANGANVAGNINWPDAQEYDMDELIGNEILFSIRPAGPACRSWKQTNIQGNYITGYNDSSGTIMSSLNSTGGLLANSIDASELCNPADFMGFAVYFSGLPATASLKYATMEVIAHYESQPIVNTSGNLTPTTEIRQASSSKTWDEQVREIRRWPIVENVQRAVHGMMDRLAGEGLQRGPNYRRLM